jgi:addiction module HigA family antidote
MALPVRAAVWMLRVPLAEHPRPLTTGRAAVLALIGNNSGVAAANRRRISADTVLRLGLHFGNSPEFWLNLQTHYDLKRGAQRGRMPQ